MSLYRPLFRVLNASGTRYVVVGGVATVLHGYPRLTADVDHLSDADLRDLQQGEPDFRKAVENARRSRTRPGMNSCRGTRCVNS